MRNAFDTIALRVVAVALFVSVGPFGCDQSEPQELNWRAEIESDVGHARVQGVIGTKNAQTELESALATAISDESPDVRSAAVETIHETVARSIVTLESVLDDTQHAVRERARKAIEDLDSNLATHRSVPKGEASASSSWLSVILAYTRESGLFVGIAVSVIALAIAAVNITRLRHAHRERLAMIERGMSPEPRPDQLAESSPSASSAR